MISSAPSSRRPVNFTRAGARARRPLRSCDRRRGRSRTSPRARATARRRAAVDIPLAMDRWPRTLDRLRAALDAVERHEVAVERRLLFAPERTQRVDILVGAAATRVERHTHRLVLTRHVPDADADDQPAARQHVDRCELLGQRHRVAQRQDHDARHRAGCVRCAPPRTRARGSGRASPSVTATATAARGDRSAPGAPRSRPTRSRAAPPRPRRRPLLRRRPAHPTRTRTTRTACGERLPSARMPHAS